MSIFREGIKVQNSLKDNKKTVLLMKNRKFHVVPKAGLEPARVLARLILSQVRLPIPPLRHLVCSIAWNNDYYTRVICFCQQLFIKKVKKFSFL